MDHVTIYTDGACSGNPGPGGWCAILICRGKEKEISGGFKHGTNNIAELTAVIEAFKCLKKSCKVDLFSDSKYVIDSLSKGWAVGWRKKRWVKSDGKPALNKELWAQLLDLVEQHDVSYHWVKGHAENMYNNRCDQKAVEERDTFAILAQADA